MKKILFFISAMVLSYGLMAQTVLFSDNFDSYTAGQKLVQQATTTNWTTWSNAPGGAEDAVISTSQASSTPNSLYITGSNDIIYPFANQTTGHYSVEFDMYVPSTGLGGYFNIQHYYAPGLEWAFQAYFYPNGTGYLEVGAAAPNGQYNFTYPSNAWFHVITDIDLDNDITIVTINGVVVHTWPFSYESFSQDGICQLGSVNFYAGAPENASGTYYVDNFSYTEVVAASLPEISVNPNTNISHTVSQTNNIPYQFAIQNNGDSPLDYRIVPTYNISNPTNNNGSEASVLGYADYNSYAGSYVRFTSETNENVEWEVAMGYPAEQLQDQIGRRITGVTVFLAASSMTNAKVRIFKMGSSIVSPGPGAMIYEQSFTPDPMLEENQIILDEPIVIDGGDIWVGVWIDQPTDTTGANGVYTDGTECNYYSNWTRSNGPSWSRMSEDNPQLTNSWMLYMVVEGDVVSPWMNASPVTGSVAASQSQTITTTFSFTDNNAGNNLGKINIFSNDFANSTIILDVNVLFVTSVEDNHINISVAPNPASDYINISSVNISKVELYNINGQLIYSGNFNGNNVSIPTSEYQAGSYFVKIFSDAGISTQKVIIK